MDGMTQLLCNLCGQLPYLVVEALISIAKTPEDLDFYVFYVWEF